MPSQISDLAIAVPPIIDAENILGIERSASPRTPKRVLAVLGVLAALGFGFLAILPFSSLVAGWDPPHWDFAVYRAAAMCRMNGVSPWEIENMRRFGVDLPWNYSPLYSLFLLPPFMLPIGVAKVGFVIAQFVAIAAGFSILARTFRLGIGGIFLMAILYALAFSGAAQVDMQAGNITAFEFPLVCGILSVSYRGRAPWWILPMVFVLALGKPQWVLFSLVPYILQPSPRAGKVAMAGIGGYLLLQGLSILLFRRETIDYWRNGLAWHETGFANPVLKEAIAEFLTVIGGPGGVAKVLWPLAVLAIAACVFVQWRRHAELRFYWLTVMVVAMPLFLPRVKPYSMVLVLPFLIGLIALYVKSPKALWPIVILALGIPSYHFWLKLNVAQGMAVLQNGSGSPAVLWLVGYSLLLQVMLLTAVLTWRGVMASKAIPSQIANTAT